ncbi:DUF4367 domain-containing protein [Mordavella massiliensis]|uniref:DUF4367 domain-containing protein n=1 Tax=Mordavella massiliensis TaxID=1871024 RepID=A0A939BG30_9CLOT|nr:DUF4367 domain-containing protein [Mordavella massiliensis]MBM6947216.1 DUF4367 domain-containing protein [Mordavella massiliensis]
MREENSKIHAEEERKNEEAFAAFMQEQLDREAAQIEEELAKSPELAGLSPDDSAKEKLYEKIEAYERQQAYGRLSPEDQEALRLGRQIQREREGSKASRIHARFFKRAAGIAAVVAIVAAVGITGVGGPARVMEVLKQAIGDREMTKVNSDEEDTVNSGENLEEQAYQEIKDVFGIDPVRIVQRSEEIKFSYMELDEELQTAFILYLKQDKTLSYIINISHSDGAWGYDIEDGLIKEYIYDLGKTKVTVQKYEIEQTKETEYSASFDYKDVHYQLTGIMTEEDLEEILDNLHFL